jgi:zinc transport system permease protein
MLDDFFMRALVAGVGLAVTAGPLGCFVVWRRMAYFGDTMAHSALLGVALSLLMNVNLLLSVFVVAATVSVLLLLLQKRGTLSTDALLGILSHATLAIGLVMVSFMTWVRIDLVGFLFGDILAVSRADVDLVWGGGILVTFAIIWMWRPLIASTVNPELAEAEGMQPEKTRLVFMLLMALVIPAATARRFSTSPEIMAVLASVVGALAVVGGLFGSLKFDTPSGPSIVVAALGLFILSLLTKPRTSGVAASEGGPA